MINYQASRTNSVFAGTIKILQRVHFSLPYRFLYCLCQLATLSRLTLVLFPIPSDMCLFFEIRSEQRQEHVPTTWSLCKSERSRSIFQETKLDPFRNMLMSTLYPFLVTTMGTLSTFSILTKEVYF